MQKAIIIESKLKEWSPSYFLLEDESENHHSPNQESHFKLIVVSEVFKGLSLITRHRKVFDHLGSELVASIHALSMELFTEEEWVASGKRAAQKFPDHH